MIEYPITYNGLQLNAEGAYKVEFEVATDTAPDPKHGVHLIRLYDENDELDIEVVTDQPYVFSISFLKEPRLITSMSIEPGRVPYDATMKN